jgi:P22 coat protein - gene protein 5
MANAISAFFQTLVTAATEASQALVGTTSLMDAIYVDYSPAAATVGQTLSIPIPAQVTTQVADAGSGDPTFTDVAFAQKTIVFNKHPQYGYVVRDFEQFNSPTSIRNLLIDPALKGIAENVNGTIAGLVNSTALNVNAPIATTGSTVTPDQFVQGQVVLIGQKVPTLDTPNMTFLQAPTPWGKLLRNADWTQESLVGAEQAIAAKKMGFLREAYGTQLGYDQQMPVSGSVGSRTFLSVLMHRFAIAAAYRPLPKPDDNVAEYTYIMWKGLPIRITLGYSISRGGWLANIDAGYGVSAVRPEMAQLFTTAE